MWGGNDGVVAVAVEVVEVALVVDGARCGGTFR
jgi:hypothetical protein